MGIAISEISYEQHQPTHPILHSQPERCVTGIVDEIKLVKDALALAEEGTFSPFESVEFSPAYLHYECLSETFEYAALHNLPSLKAVLASTAEEACIEVLLKEITDHILERFNKELPKLKTDLTERFINGLKGIYPLLDEQRMRDWIAQCIDSHGADFELMFCNGRSDEHTGNQTSQAVLTISTIYPCIYNLYLPTTLQDTQIIDAANTIAVGALHAPFDAMLEYSFDYGELIQNLDLTNVKSEQDILKQKSVIITHMQEMGMCYEDSTEEEYMETFNTHCLETVMMLVELREKRTKGKKIHDFLVGMAKLENTLETYIHSCPAKGLLTSKEQYWAINEHFAFDGYEPENTYLVSPLKAVQSMLDVATNITLLTFIDAIGCYNTPFKNFKPDSIEELTDNSYETLPLLPR